MRPDAALPIIRALADGVNPVTGEQYHEDSPYAEPRALRALFAAADCLQAEVDRQARKDRLPINFGRPWDADEDTRARTLYGNGYKVDAIATVLKRTTSSVRLRLRKLGVMPAGGDHE